VFVYGVGSDILVIVDLAFTRELIFARLEIVSLRKDGPDFSSSGIGFDASFVFSLLSVLKQWLD
jgi:hypothetical protein